MNGQILTTRLVAAVLRNDTVQVKEALKAGADPNAEMEGWAWSDFVHPITNVLTGDMRRHLRDTPLLLTMDNMVQRGAKATRGDGIPLENLATVKALVEAGADVNARTKTGNTTLELAVMWEYNATAHYLLEHGADPNLVEDGRQMAPLHFAAVGGNLSMVKDLLEHHANPNAKEILGETPLFLAALPKESPNQLEVIKLLLRYHADPTLKDHDDMTVMDRAKQDGQTAIISILKQHYRR